MKKFSFKTIMLVLAVFLFGGLLNVKADTVLPSTFKTDSNDRVKLTYIYYTSNENKKESYSLIAKKASDGTLVYCLDMNKEYHGNMTYTKTNTLDVGINYILTHKPNTGDANKDYYITQMAVYYYMDYVNGKPINLSDDFKKLIVIGATVKNNNLDNDTRKVCTEIYNLYLGAYKYRQDYMSSNGH